MEQFERRFAELLSGSTLPMDEVMRYVGAVPGKRLRPMLVYQSARLFGDITETTHRTALFVELLHTATLIHDDVVDASDTRRGQASVNARFGNKTAVLAGDYLLSKAMQLLTDPSDSEILKTMLDTAMAMSEGELMQSGKWRVESGKLKVKDGELKVKSEERYLDIITRKTAQLIQACCVCGALSSHSPLYLPSVGEGLRLSTFHSPLSTFSLGLGLVFQMRDDILDHDDPATAALAEKLLPEYLNKTLQSLEALAPEVPNPSVLDSFREITLFCASRNH